MLKLLFLLLLGAMHAHEKETITTTTILQKSAKAIADLSDFLTATINKEIHIKFLDFYESVTKEIRKKTFTDLIKSLDPLMDKLGEITHDDQNSSEALRNITKIVYYNCIFLFSIFTLPLRSIDKSEIQNNLKTVTKSENIHNEKIQETIFNLIENLNQEFVAGKSAASKASDQKNDNNLLLNQLIRSHLVALNQYLLTQFPINQPSIAPDVQAVKSSLENFLAPFLRVAIQLHQKAISSNILVTFNQDLALLLALLT